MAKKMKVHEVQKVAAQGDMFLIKVDAIPAEAVEVKGNDIVLAHSETGHNHVFEPAKKCKATYYQVPNDPLTAYLKVEGGSGDVVHQRENHTHETLRLFSGYWKIKRQREKVPTGWRMVAD